MLDIGCGPNYEVESTDNVTDDGACGKDVPNCSLTADHKRFQLTGCLQ